MRETLLASAAGIQAVQPAAYFSLFDVKEYVV